MDVDGAGIGTPLLRAPVSAWEFRLEPVDEGTRLTQTWTDRRPSFLPEVAFRPFDLVSTGSRRRVEHSRKTMYETLRRLKADLEGSR